MRHAWERPSQMRAQQRPRPLDPKTLGTTHLLPNQPQHQQLTTRNQRAVPLRIIQKNAMHEPMPLCQPTTFSMRPQGGPQLLRTAQVQSVAAQ